MKTTEKSSEQVKFENDNLAQVQGFPDFESSPKGDPTTDVKKTISNMSKKLDDVITPEQEDEFYSAQFEEHMRMVMESEQPLWMISIYGK
jgi:hypothetical protein